MSAAATSPSPAALSRERLLGVAGKRLEKFAALLPKALVSDRPGTIHDIRVWSRRLQQVLKVLFPKPRANSSRKLIRALRKVRRALGDCRNLDVSIALIQDRREHASSEAARDAWAQTQAHLAERRQAESARCRGELSRCDIVAFVLRAQEQIQTVKLARALDQTLRGSVDGAFAGWQDALAAARESRGMDSIHAFRIAGKRLRYRAELLADLGEGSCKSLVKSLKRLQDDLGYWHDCQVLMRFVAGFIGRPDFLVDRPEMSRILLTEMEKERQRNDSAIGDIFKNAEKIRGWKWVAALEFDGWPKESPRDQ